MSGSFDLEKYIVISSKDTSTSVIREAVRGGIAANRLRFETVQTVLSPDFITMNQSSGLCFLFPTSSSHLLSLQSAGLRVDTSNTFYTFNTTSLQFNHFPFHVKAFMFI